MSSAAELPPLPRFDVRQEDLETAMVVTVAGEVDSATVPAMREALLRAAAEFRPRFVVDLRRVSYLDSLGITVLVQAFDRVRCAGMAVQVACGSETALLLQSLGIDAEVAIVGTRDEALALPDSDLRPPSNPELPAVEPDPPYRAVLREARALVESGQVPADEEELARLRYALDDVAPSDN